MNEFKDKVVLITGAAGNLGQAAAEVFSAKGANLALQYQCMARADGGFQIDYKRDLSAELPGTAIALSVPADALYLFSDPGRLARSSLVE